jgi:hypothetical protein
MVGWLVAWMAWRSVVKMVVETVVRLVGMMAD